MLTTILDYKSRVNLPKSWPKDLSDFELCVDNETAPLMISPSGQFIVPASCPGPLLGGCCSFIRLYLTQYFTFC